MLLVKWSSCLPSTSTMAFTTDSMTIWLHYLLNIWSSSTKKNCTICQSTFERPFPYLLKQFLIILFGWDTFVLIASINSGLICFQYFSTHEDNNDNGRSMNSYKQNQIFSHDKLHFSSVIFYSKLVTFCQLGNWYLYRIKIIDLSLQIQNFVIFCMLLFLYQMMDK